MTQTAATNFTDQRQAQVSLQNFNKSDINVAQSFKTVGTLPQVVN